MGGREAVVNSRAIRQGADRAEKSCGPNGFIHCVLVRDISMDRNKRVVRYARRQLVQARTIHIASDDQIAVVEHVVYGC